MRLHDPAHWHAHPDGGGYWVLSKHADWDQFREWADQQTLGDDPEVVSPEQQQQASLQMGVYGYELALQKQGKGGDDISSLLLNVGVEGHKGSIHLNQLARLNGKRYFYRAG